MVRHPANEAVAIVQCDLCDSKEAGGLCRVWEIEHGNKNTTSMEIHWDQPIEWSHPGWCYYIYRTIGHFPDAREMTLDFRVESIQLPFIVTTNWSKHYGLGDLTTWSGLLLAGCSSPWRRVVHDRRVIAYPTGSGL